MDHVVVCSSHLQVQAYISPVLYPCCRLRKEGTEGDACLYHLLLCLRSYIPLGKDRESQDEKLKVNEQITFKEHYELV